MRSKHTSLLVYPNKKFAKVIWIFVDFLSLKCSDLRLLGYCASPSIQGTFIYNDLKRALSNFFLSLSRFDSLLIDILFFCSIDQIFLFFYFFRSPSFFFVLNAENMAPSFLCSRRSSKKYQRGKNAAAAGPRKDTK